MNRRLFFNKCAAFVAGCALGLNLRSSTFKSEREDTGYELHSCNHKPWFYVRKDEGNRITSMWVKNLQDDNFVKFI